MYWHFMLTTGIGLVGKINSAAVNLLKGKKIMEPSSASKVFIHHNWWLMEDMRWFGSNRTDAQNAIQKVLKERPPVSIRIGDVKINDHKIDLTYSLGGHWQHINLVAILVQKQAVVNVKAGENEGVQLNHTNVVRLIKKLPAAQSGRIDLTKPDGLNDNNWQVILFTQREDGIITGAARIGSR